MLCGDYGLHKVRCKNMHIVVLHPCVGAYLHTHRHAGIQTAAGCAGYAGVCVINYVGIKHGVTISLAAPRAQMIIYQSPSHIFGPFIHCLGRRARAHETCVRWCFRFALFVYVQHHVRMPTICGLNNNSATAVLEQ